MSCRTRRFRPCCTRPSVSVRKAAFHQYYDVFAAHENTLAATLSGSIQRDVYYAKARGYASAREAALFPDNMPLSVYDNLIAAVRRAARRRGYATSNCAVARCGCDEIHHYDTYVPILSELRPATHLEPGGRRGARVARPAGRATTAACWQEGLDSAAGAIATPIGASRAAPSVAARSTAPYILMNYQPDVLDHVFTLAHEAGHSMHSYYSAKQPAVPVLQLRDLRRRSGQHVQRATAQPR